MRGLCSMQIAVDKSLPFVVRPFPRLCNVAVMRLPSFLAAVEPREPSPLPIKSKRAQGSSVRGPALRSERAQLSERQRIRYNKLGRWAILYI